MDKKLLMFFEGVCFETREYSARGFKEYLSGRDVHVSETLDGLFQVRDSGGKVVLQFRDAVSGE